MHCHVHGCAAHRRSVGRGRRGWRVGRARSGRRLPGQLGAGGDGRRGRQGGRGGPRRRARSGRRPPRRNGRRPCTGPRTRVAAVADELAPGARPPRWASRWADARGGVEAGVGTLRQYAELGPVHGGRTLHGATDAIDLMAPQPRGVVAAITPWNDPVAVSCGPARRGPGHRQRGALQAERAHPGDRLAAGPAARPRSCRPGCCRCSTGGAEVGAALAAQEVDVVAHVGSTATGRAIAAACARTGAKVLLENGGSDPLIVDARRRPGAGRPSRRRSGAFANAGQICVAVERIYVHRDVADAFLAALVERAEALRTGPGRDPRTELGPLVDRRHRDHVHAAGDRGGGRRARGCCTGGDGAGRAGRVLPGRPCWPTAADDMAVVREETFGPVAPVVVVDSFDEALRWAARLPVRAGRHGADRVDEPRRSGPGGSCRWARSRSTRCSAGAPGGAAHPRRGSGQGFGYGPELLDEMTATKAVHIERARAAATGERRGRTRRWRVGPYRVGRARTAAGQRRRGPCGSRRSLAFWMALTSSGLVMLDRPGTSSFGPPSSGGPWWRWRPRRRPSVPAAPGRRRRPARRWGPCGPSAPSGRRPSRTVLHARRRRCGAPAPPRRTSRPPSRASSPRCAAPSPGSVAACWAGTSRPGISSSSVSTGFRLHAFPATGPANPERRVCRFPPPGYRRARRSRTTGHPAAGAQGAGMTTHGARPARRRTGRPRIPGRMRQLSWSHLARACWSAACGASSRTTAPTGRRR